MKSDREKLILVSSNPNKAIEAERILGMPLLRVAIGLPEIQAADVEDVTRYKLEVARTKGYGRLVVEDVSLGFDELGNFPGPFVRWLLEAPGGTGLAVIAYALRNRSAKAQCCVAYWDGQMLTLKAPTQFPFEHTCPSGHTAPAHASLHWPASQ